MRFPSLRPFFLFATILAGAQALAAEGDSAPVVSSVVASNVTFTSASIVVSLSDVGTGNGNVSVTVEARQGDLPIGTRGSGLATVETPAVCPISGLVQGQTYTVWVTARGGNKLSTTDSSLVFSTQAYTEPTIDSVSVSAGFTTVTAAVSFVDFGAGSSSAGIRVDALDSLGTSVAHATASVSNLTGAACVLTGLADGTAYTLRASATGSNGLSSTPQDTPFETRAFTAPVLGLVSVTDLGTRSASFSVALESPGAGSASVSFSVEARNADGISVARASGTVSTARPGTCTLTGLAPGTDYVAVVVLTGSNGKSLTDTNTVFTTLSNTAPKIGTVSVGSISFTDASVAVSLADLGRGSPAVTVLVEALSPAGTVACRASRSATSPDGCTVPLSGLAQATAYTLRITLTGANGLETVDTATSFTTRAAGRPALDRLEVSSVSTRSAVASFDVTDLGEGNAFVQLRIDAIGPGGVSASYATASATAPGAYSFPVSNLVPDTDYRVRIVATGSLGPSVTNETLTFRTSGGNVPTLANLQVRSIAAYSAIVSLDVADLGEGNAYANLQFDAIGPNGTSKSHATASASAPGSVSKTLASLSLGTTYTVRIVATGSTGASVTNETLSFTTKTNATPIVFGPATATVATNGASALLAVPVLNVSGGPVAVTLSLNGIRVSAWSVADEGPLSFSVPVRPGSTNAFEFAGQLGTYVARATGSFIATTLRGWFDVRFSSDSGYNVGTNWTDVSRVAEPGGAWTKPSGDVSELVASNRTVRLENSAGVLYRPTAPSEPGADVVFEGRFTASLHESLPESNPERKSGWCLVASPEGNPVPYAFSKEDWLEMAWVGEPPAADAWYDLRATYDFMSASAPRVRWEVNGMAVVVATTGSPWVPLRPDMTSISNVSFSGTGNVGDFRGSYYSLLSVTPPIEMPVFREGPDSLSFAGEGDGATFSVTVADPIEGAWYTAFSSPTLTGEFISEGPSVRATVAHVLSGALSLSVSAREPSKFVRVVASTDAIPEGVALSSLLTASPQP